MKQDSTNICKSCEKNPTRLQLKDLIIHCLDSSEILLYQNEALAIINQLCRTIPVPKDPVNYHYETVYLSYL
jgi:hypothetical protein